MKGEYFTKMLQEGVIEFGPEESIEDLEKMYNIILNVRGKDYQNANKFDEVLALIILCKIPFPGKRPKYKIAVSKIKDTFCGISRDKKLQENFKKIIGKQVVKAQSLKGIRLNKKKDVFHD